jgi:hypothetical protein
VGRLPDRAASPGDLARGLTARLEPVLARRLVSSLDTVYGRADDVFSIDAR